MRDWGLRAVALAGVAVVAITETLSASGALRPVPLAICWAIALAAIGWFVGRPGKPRIPFDPCVWAVLAGAGLVLVLTGVTAVFSPPNSADAMAYHLPRVVYWAEQGSVRFFPTPYLNQIMLQPFAEYCVLHTYLLAGGDWLANLVQWTASVISVAGVSAIAGRFGASVRGQAAAALFCATAPCGVLASSGAKNDYVLAMWMVLAVYFALGVRERADWNPIICLGAAAGLAMLTKATAFLFLPWPLLVILGWRPSRRLALAAVIAATLNAPQWVRNVGLSGSPMGFDSAQGDGFFRWRNERFGWGPTVSNILRNGSEQLGQRSERWNRAVYAGVVGLHERLGLDPNDPDTTWRWTRYAAPRNANHEADAPNPWHLAILALAFCVGRGRQRLYLAALACGFVAFCAYLKWQPFMARLFLPLIVLGAPAVAVVVDRLGRRVVVTAALCLFLLDVARRPALDNWVRPLRGERSVLRVAREDQYFSDMGQWANADAYRRTVERVAGSGRRTVGIDAAHLQLEYPLEALLRRRVADVRFLHTGVRNASSRYAQPVEGPPGLVVCLDCAGDAGRLALYPDYPRRVEVERFVVLER